MLNEEKIKLMTKASIYEKDRQKDIATASKYFLGDYVTYNMVKTAVAITIAYCLCILVYVMWKFEEIISRINGMDYMNVVKYAIIIYVILIAVYMFVSFAFYTLKYRRCRKYLKVYSARLKKIDKISDEELSMTGKLGGTLEDDKYTGI